MSETSAIIEAAQPQQDTTTERIEPTWLTYAQAEELTGYSQVTLWRLIKRTGEIKVVRIGRTLRINRRSLENYLESQAEQG